MIRAFTISFDFRGRTYLALASMTTSESDVSYFVRVYDDDLCRILPDGNLSYNKEKVIKNNSITHPLANQLFQCIDDSVNCHIKATQ